MDEDYEENVEDEFADDLLAEIESAVDDDQDELDEEHCKEWNRNLAT